jgi:hypothetical protein
MRARTRSSLQYFGARAQTACAESGRKDIGDCEQPSDVRIPHLPLQQYFRTHTID